MRNGLMLVCLLVGTTACGDPPWVGEFETNATWDLSGPLANGRTVGDAVADFFVGHLVGLLPVPGPLEGQAQEHVDELLRGHVKSLVDVAAPASLQPGGAVSQALSQALGSVAVRSTLVLEEATLDDMEGVETLEQVSFDAGGVQHELDALDLTGGAALRAEWEGDEDDHGLEVFDHDVPLHYGALVAQVAEQLVQAAELSSLAGSVAGAVDCAAIVSAVLDGQAGLTLSIGSWDTTIEGSTFTEACEAVKDLAGEKALGLFALDAAVTLGGKITVREAGDDVTLESRSGFGGTVNVAPSAIAPRLVVELTATRR